MEARPAGWEARSAAVVVSGAAAVGVVEADLDDVHAASVRISLFSMVVKKGGRDSRVISIEKRD